MQDPVLDGALEISKCLVNAPRRVSAPHPSKRYGTYVRMHICSCHAVLETVCSCRGRFMILNTRVQLAQYEWRRALFCHRQHAAHRSLQLHTESGWSDRHTPKNEYFQITRVPKTSANQATMFSITTSKPVAGGCVFQFSVRYDTIQVLPFRLDS